jgi:hypothetical protein
MPQAIFQLECVYVVKKELLCQAPFFFVASAQSSKKFIIVWYSSAIIMRPIPPDQSKVFQPDFFWNTFDCMKEIFPKEWHEDVRLECHLIRSKHSSQTIFGAIFHLILIPARIAIVFVISWALFPYAICRRRGQREQHKKA